MRTIRIAGRGKKSLFLVAETELDKSLVGALRTFGAAALYLHRELPDKPFEELVRDEVQGQIDGEALARELMGRDSACRHGRAAAGLDDGRCLECLGERRQELLESLAEVEVRVLCCPGARDDGSGHDDGCAVPPAVEDRADIERRYRLGVSRGLSRALARWQGLRDLHDDPGRASEDFVRQMNQDISDELEASDASPWGGGRDAGAPEWPRVVGELLEVARAAEEAVDRGRGTDGLEDAVARLRQAREARSGAGII